MSLPEDLQAALEDKLSHTPNSKLMAAGNDLSKRYRNPHRNDSQKLMETDEHRLAYLATRLPATYAVNQRVLHEIKQRVPEFAPQSLADLGAGPGTASWAAVNTFDQIKDVNLFETDMSWLALGKSLMQKSQHQSLCNAKWNHYNLANETISSTYDLVIMSYVIGELPLTEIPSLAAKAWQVTSQVLVIIEPGTPHGFERIRAVRQALIDLGAHMVAPCPHTKACPMPSRDWCHFSERLERSFIHKYLKEGTLGYEDEKFSYVAVSKNSIAHLPKARILRHPQRHSGHIELTLCAQNGLEKTVVSRRHGDAYKRARKAEWGDPWD